MAAYCAALLVQAWRGTEREVWPFALVLLTLFLAQLLYPTKLGWLLSIALLAVAAALFLTDPFHNLGPGREFGIILSIIFCSAVYKNRP